MVLADRRVWVRLLALILVLWLLAPVGSLREGVAWALYGVILGLCVPWRLLLRKREALPPERDWKRRGER